MGIENGNNPKGVMGEKLKVFLSPVKKTKRCSRFVSVNSRAQIDGSVGALCRFARRKAVDGKAFVASQFRFQKMTLLCNMHPAGEKVIRVMALLSAQKAVFIGEIHRSSEYES